MMADLLSRLNQVQSTEWSLHPKCIQTDLSQLVQPSCRSLCHSPEPQSSTVHVSSPRPKCLGHRCSEHKLVVFHCLCLPSYDSPSQSDPKSQAIQLPDHRNSPRLARDALVLEPSAALNRGPTLTFSVTNSSQTVPQLSTSQPPDLVSRSGQLQEQGFSVEVAEKIDKDHQQGPFTSQSGPYLRKWYRENSVDFSTSSVKQVSDTFMYLYQDLNRRPSTIDGHRTAIVDTLGLHISQSSDLNRLLSRFYRDHPKSSRNIPKWNLSMVLKKLTKAHLTLKTAFLLALASSKCHSEIHAWVANKVSNLANGKSCLDPLFRFHSQNRTSKRRFSKCVSGDYSCSKYHCR